MSLTAHFEHLFFSAVDVKASVRPMSGGSPLSITEPPATSEPGMRAVFGGELEQECVEDTEIMGDVPLT